MLLWGAMEVFRDKLDALTAMTTSAAEEAVSVTTPTHRKKKKGKNGTVKTPEIREETVLESELPAESLLAEVEPVTFPVEEPLVETDPLPEPEPEGDIWAISATKSKKGKMTVKEAMLMFETSTPPGEPVAFPNDEPLLEEEPLVEEKPVPEPEAEVVEECSVPTKKSKKAKKKKGTLSALVETFAPTEVPAGLPIAEGWLGAESESFSP